MGLQMRGQGLRSVGMGMSGWGLRSVGSWPPDEGVGPWPQSEGVGSEVSGGMASSWGVGPLGETDLEQVGVAEEHEVDPGQR